MKILEEALEQGIKHALAPHRIMAVIIERKLAARGVILSDEKKQQIETQLKDIDVDSLILELDEDDFFLDEDKRIEEIDLTLDFSEDDDEVESILSELPDRIANVIPELIAEISTLILEDLKSKGSDLLIDRRKTELGFKTRLLEDWQLPIDLFEMHLHIAVEAGQDFNDEFRPIASEEGDFVFEVLTRLHARACQISSEVLTLLTSGHADGAHARWRSLHEIATVGFFIKEHGNELAERYLLHEAIESYKAALQYQEHASSLGLDPIPEEEMRDLRSARNALVRKYGKAYGDGFYGWSADALGNDRPSFHNIEKAVGLDHLRPYYRLASHNVHANPKGAFFRLGLMPDANGILLAGPSNIGLADPGHASAISLSQITMALITLKPNVDRLVATNILMSLADEIGEAFLQVHKRIEERWTG
jgi:hypothetical protein